MKIKLLKSHTFHSRELAEGTELEVTNELANRMIKSGKAMSVEKLIQKDLSDKLKGKKPKKEKKDVILQNNNQEKKPDTKE
jgi:hypothetical protein